MPWPAEASIDFTATGDNILIPAVAGQLIEVWQLFLTVSDDTLLTFKDGVGGTAYDGPLSLDALVFDPVGDHRDPTRPWFTTSTGNAFVLHQTGTVQVSGRIYYTRRQPH